MKKKIISTLSVIAVLGSFCLLPAFQQLPPKPLTSIATALLPTFDNEQADVVVTVKALTGGECKQLIMHDVVSRGVQPLQLTIENNTSETYSLCPSSVDLDRIEASKVAFKVTKSTIPRAIGYKIASFFFWPFMIPSTIDSIRTMHHHAKFKKDLKAKSMKEESIPPYSTFHRLIFVPESKLKEKFNVTLIELESLEHHVTEVHLELKKEAPKEAAAAG